MVLGGFQCFSRDLGSFGSRETKILVKTEQLQALKKELDEAAPIAFVLAGALFSMIILKMLSFSLPLFLAKIVFCSQN